VPYTVGNYLADAELPKVTTEHESFAEAASTSSETLDKLLSIDGDKTVVEFHRELGKIMWDKVGISRSKEGLEEAVEQIRALREEFYENVRVPGDATYYNKYLEFAHRVADFFELAELMAIDALDRDESCGCHLREEYQTEEGEALRNDDDFSYVSAWEYGGVNGKLNTTLHKESLEFEFVELKQRSYK